MNTPKHSIQTLRQASRDEKGLCLSCGKIQPFIQYRMPFSPCTSCGDWNVMHARAILRAFCLVQAALPPVGRVIEASNDYPPILG